LGISSGKAEMIGCSLVDVLRWQGQRAAACTKRLGTNVSARPARFEPQGRVVAGQDKVEGLISREPSNLC